MKEQKIEIDNLDKKSVIIRLEFVLSRPRNTSLMAKSLEIEPKTTMTSIEIKEFVNDWMKLGLYWVKRPLAY